MSNKRGSHRKFLGKKIGKGKVIDMPALAKHDFSSRVGKLHEFFPWVINNYPIEAHKETV
ncbi:MAG TPA: hypothetical protein VFC58_04875 [Desulfosporosinus sp.]|nr:hypothetical protein [Desulfosporosinus sp.]